jgi:type II secretory pathway component PulC
MSVKVTQWLLGGLLLAWCLHLAIQLVGHIQLLGQVSVSNQAVPNITSVPSSHFMSRPVVDIAALKAITLFYTHIPTSQKTDVFSIKPESKEELKESVLKLSLVGSFSNTDPKNSYAIIENNRKHALYRVGETMTNANKLPLELIEVFTDKVIISNNGKQEIISMYPKDEPATSSSDTALMSSFVPLQDEAVQDNNNQNNYTNNDLVYSEAEFKQHPDLKSFQSDAEYEQYMAELKMKNEK